MVGKLNMTSFELMVAGLCKLMIAAILCELAVAVARLYKLAIAAILKKTRFDQVADARLNLSDFEWTAAVARLCEFAMAAIYCEQVVAVLKLDSGAQERLVCKALGWRVRAEDLWVDRAMVERRQDPKLVTARVRNQRAELEC